MSASPFDFIDEEPESPKSLDTQSLVWNIASVLLLLATAVVVFVFLAIFINPQSGLNPLSPPTLPVLIAPATFTPTPRNLLPPTWTPDPADIPTPTDTPAPTDALPPTNEPPPTVMPSPTEGVEPSPTEDGESSSTEDGEPSSTDEVEEAFQIQEGSPAYISNFAHQEEGCDWLGVAGQIFDISGEPITDSSVVIKIGGTLNGEELTARTLTGMREGEPYGAGGYEIVLSGATIASSDTLWIQLASPSADLALSEKIFFDTFDDCEKNLILITFVQID